MEKKIQYNCVFYKNKAFSNSELLSARCQNIHLVPKSFNMYRVRCITGGALLAPLICYRIAEKPPPNMSNSTSDIFAG
jgi:hypothetical protein